MAEQLENLFENPLFQMGVGLFGSSNPRNQPLLNAFQLMQQSQAARRERELQQQRLKLEQEQFGLQREEAGFMRPLRQEQINIARTNAETNAAILEQRKREEVAKAKRIEWFQKNLPHLLQGQLPIEGLVPPQPGMQPQSGPADALAEPMVGEPTGKFGTPVRYLDALEKVESSGNPLAVGPVIGWKNGKPVRAQGAYQFLPDTVDMVANSGFGKFDPFKRDQARDAADFYIQQLYKKHGSYAKAFAAYGGFKKENPTQYVTKVMGGPPERQAREQAQNQANQGMQQGNQYAPVMAPGLKIDLMEGNVDLNLTPSYEPHKLRQGQERIDIDRATQRREDAKFFEEYGPDGLKKREAERQDVGTGLDINKDRREEAEAARIAEEKMFARREMKAKDRKAFGAANANTDLLSGKIDKLVAHPGLPRIAGLKGTFPDFPGSDAAAARAQLSSIVAQNAKETLTAMRDASKTGGALGNVSDADVKLLERAIQNLETAQGAPALKAALIEVQKQADRLRNIAITAYEDTYRESPIDPDLPVGSRLSDKRTKDGRPLYRAPNGKLYEVQ